MADVMDNSDISGSIQSLRADVDKLKSQSADRFKKFTTFLGLAGGVLGIIAASLELPGKYAEWRASPQTELRTQEVAVTYEPGDSTFAIKFPLLMDNEGDGIDVIKNAESELVYSPGSDPGRLKEEQTDAFNAGIGQFSFYDKGSLGALSAADQVQLPLYVGKKSARPVFLSILFDKGTFTKAGLNQLNVDLTSQRGKSYTVSFCFYLDDAQILDLQRSETGGRKRFLNASCGV